MSGAGPRGDEVLQAAAAVLVLVEGQSAEIADTMRDMADAAELARIERALVTGDRSERARALAAPLGRIALALEQWGLR